MFNTTYTFTHPNFDIHFFYSQIDTITSHFNITYQPIGLFTTNTFIFTSDNQTNIDNFIKYLNGDTSNY